MMQIKVILPGPSMDSPPVAEDFEGEAVGFRIDEQGSLRITGARKGNVMTSCTIPRGLWLRVYHSREVSDPVEV